MSAKDALEKYYAREARKSMRQPRTNQKPEFEFKKLAVKWLEDNGWSINVVESKAVYNFAAGRYDHGQTDAGFSDIVGVTPYYGVACFIELKAPGKRSTLKWHQYEFLVGKIMAGAFAICADSITCISETYSQWVEIRKSQGHEVAATFLVESLPPIKEPTDNLSDIIDE